MRSDIFKLILQRKLCFIDKDIDDGKQVADKMVEAADTCYDAVTDKMIEKTGLNKE